MAKRKSKAEEMLKYFPKKALAALRSGGEWEFEPETVELGRAFVERAEPRRERYGKKRWGQPPPEGWWQYWYVDGWSVTKGRLIHVIWQVDRGGDWDAIDEHDVDEPGYEEWLKQYSLKESRRSWCEYFRWVAEHGVDPVHELFASARRKQSAEWEFVIRETQDGLLLVQARPVGQKDWLQPHQLPGPVQGYFDFGDLKTLEALMEASPDSVQWNPVSEVEARGVTEIEMQVEADPEVVKAAARKQLKECR